MNGVHMFSAIHPPIFELLHKCFGVRQIGEVFIEPDLNVEMMPFMQMEAIFF